MRRLKYTLVLSLMSLIALIGLGFSWTPVVDAQTMLNIDWVRIASQPRPNGEAHSVVLNGRLYSFGGFAPCCTPTRRSYYYDPKEDVWVRIADLPKGVTHAGAATDGRYVYLAGGYIERPGGGQIFGTNEVWRYDPTSNTYQAMPNLPARNSTGQLVFLSGSLHYIGGTTYGSRAADLDTHWVLNLTSGATTWTNAAPLPNARQHAAAVVHDQQIYYIGGQKGHDGKLVPQNTVHRYNPANNTWTELAPMPGVGRNHISFSTLVINGKIVVFGGQTNNNTLVDNITEYDPATNTWRELGKLFAARASAIVGLIDGVVYFATGSSAAAYKGHFAPLAPMKIENFTLIDTAEDYPIAVIRDGSTLDLAALPSSLSIGIVFSGWPIGSVVMGWNDNPRFRVENGAPYAYYDNSGTNYSAGPILLGENVLTATPYSGANGGGAAGTPLTIRFNVVRSSFANRAPQVTNPGNQSSSVMAPITPLQIVASDPDGHPLTYSATGLPAGLSINPSTGVISGTPTTEGTGNVTITVRDNGSPQLNTSIAFTWTISSNNLAVTAITFVDPATDAKVMNITNGTTYNLFDLPPGLNVGVEISGAPIGSVVFGFNGNPRFKVENIAVYSLYDNSGSNYLPGNLPAGTHTVTVTPYRGSSGTGEAGLSRTVTFTLTGNRPPVVTTPNAQSHMEDSPIAPLQIVASDPENTPLRYSATGLPAGLAINPTTGSISGTPTTPGTTDVTVTVTDGGSPAGTASVTFKWTITERLVVTQIVLIDAETDLPIMNISDGMTINLAEQPTQLNVGITTTGAPIGSVIFGFNGNGRYKVENLAVYGLFDNSGNNYAAGVLPLGENTITVTPYTGSNGGGTAGTGRTVTFTVIDEASSAPLQSQKLAANQPPTITAPADQVSTVNTPIVPLQIAATDPENGLLRYAADLPSGLTIDPVSGLITGTPTQQGTYTVTLRAIDEGALLGAATFVWVIRALTVTTTNQAPAVSTVSDQTSEEGAPVSLTLLASDPDGDTLTYSAAGLPAGLTLDATTGVITGSALSPGVSSVTLTVTDSGTPTLSSSAAFVWTVTAASALPAANQAPTLTPVTDQSGVEGEAVTLQLTASDAEGPVTYTAVGLPAGLTLDASSGLISGTLATGSAAASPATVTVTVTDAGGLTAAQSFQWLVSAAP